MHTFFINTSEKKFDEYSILWDINRENKKLVSLDCPFSDWFIAEKGYVNCVKQMRDMIEAYTELDNSFNVIVYIDLTSNPLYASIGKSAFDSRESKACLDAMHTLYSNAISSTLLLEFARNVREPDSLLVMFGQYAVKELENISQAEPDESDIHEKLAAFIGMPETNEIEEIAKKIDSEEDTDKISIFKKRIMDVWADGLFPDIMRLYEEESEIWYDCVMVDKNVEKANRAFLNAIIKSGETKAKMTHSISCPCDYFAGGNKSAEALNQLNVLIHVLKCIETGSIFEKTDVADTKLKKFHIYSATEIATLLKKKEQVFSEKLKETEHLSESYSEYKLAPELYDFDHEKFCLDEFGYHAAEFVVSTDADENEKKSEEDADAPKKISGTYEDLNQMDRIEVVQAQLTSLFSPQTYKLFECETETEDDNPNLKTSPEEHIEFGKSIKRLHNDFLKKFKMHISERLSAYAGKSKENKPALLAVGEYRYSTKKQKEKKSLETVEKISDNAYITVLKRYMEFCAGRSVSVTDIRSHCDIFVTRIRQIAASLCKKTFVALVAIAFFVILYMPFFVISRKFIAHNTVTTFCFFASFLLPLICIGGAYIYAMIKQKRKYLEERCKLAKESEKIMSENKDTATKYDQLLSSVIPALRWVYEYKLDVEHYAECCRIAERKIAHHKSKLSERVRAIQNILSDIECSDLEYTMTEYVTSEVDYGVPFCFGENNIKFYTITDKQFFKDTSDGEVDGE